MITTAPSPAPARRLPLSRSVRAGSIVAAALSVLAASLVIEAPNARAEDPAASVTEETVVGELVRVWAEPEHAHEGDHGVHAEPLTYVEPDSGAAIRVPTGDVEEIPVGATVELTLGGEVADEAAAQGGMAPARQVLSAEVVAPATAEGSPPAAAATGLTNEVTVAMVVPAGATQDGTTLSQVVDAVNGPVAEFWATESQGAVSLGVTAAHDWSTTVTPGLTTTTAACSDYLALWKEVGDRVGFVAGPGKHLMLYVTGSPPDLSGCSYGLAEVGTGPGYGGRLYVRGIATSLIAHELGHNFGLGHASALQCDRRIESGTCQVASYNDLYDVMGFSWTQAGSLNAPHAARLGFLPGEHEQSLSAASTGGAYTLSPVSGRTGTRAIRLTDAQGRVYWLEYRTPSGRDLWLGTDANLPKLQSGVVLRRAREGADTSLLLDGSPSASSGWASDRQVALPLGMPVAVSGDGFRVTVQRVTASEARVWIGTPAGRATSGNQSRPTGRLDEVSFSSWGSSLQVRGWAFDPDTPKDVLSAHLYLNGRGIALPADGHRPDVGQAYPSVGDRHGLFTTLPVVPGNHEVCAFAIDSAAVGNSRLDCRTVSVPRRMPMASLDGVSAAGATVTVRGWAFDQDTPTNTIPVHVYIDGKGISIPANGSRPDVGKAFPPVGNAHGFSYSTQLSAGPHEVCVFAIDSRNEGNRSLGCRKVTVTPYLPIGSLDEVSVSGSTISVRGWTFDPDTPTTTLRAHVYVSTKGTSIAADGDRPDVGAAFPAAGSLHGYTFATAAVSGDHRVCVYGIDSAGDGSTLLGCKTVVVP
jgi:hypothetical protein